jgi:hypothetical protein
VDCVDLGDGSVAAGLGGRLLAANLARLGLLGGAGGLTATSASAPGQTRCNNGDHGGNAPGGLLGLIADRIAEGQAGRVLQQSLANVRALVGAVLRFRCFARPEGGG